MALRVDDDDAFHALLPLCYRAHAIDNDDWNDDEQSVIANAREIVRNNVELLANVARALERAFVDARSMARTNAIAIMASMTTEDVVEKLNNEALLALCVLYANAIGDGRCAGRAARAARLCVERDASAATSQVVARAVFAQCDVKRLVLRDRLDVLTLGVRAMEVAPRGALEGAGAGASDVEAAVRAVVAAFDGERDPRVVLLLSDAWHALVRALNAFEVEGARAMEANAEELYDVAASYFPVSFTPPRTDAVKITRAQLARAVERAMVCSPTFAPFAVAHVLESLNPELGAQKMADAARATRAMGDAWGRDVMVGYLDIIWRAMRVALAHPNAVKRENDDEDDAQATTPMAIMTTMFASAWGGPELARMALSDSSARDANATMVAASACATSASSACAKTMTNGEVNASGCCGGGCGGGDARGDDARGGVVVATAGRVLGAVAAASPALAREVMCVTIKSLFDAGTIGGDDATNKASYLALMLATPALGGALDCCLRAARSGSSATMSALDDESERLVRLFSSAALGNIASAGENASDAVVLGLAGLHMMCKFPPGFGLASDAARAEACDKLVEAIVSDREGESEDDVETRLERAIDALVAAASGWDDALTRAARGVAVSRLFALVRSSELQSVRTARALRALSALARANDSIRNDVARFMCAVLIDALTTGSPGAVDVVDVCCRDEDGVFERFVTSDDAREACEALASFCMGEDHDWSSSLALDARSTMRITIAAVANSSREAQRRFAARAFANASSKPLLASATMCGLEPGIEIDITSASSAMCALANVAMTTRDAHLMRYAAAACGSMTHKFPVVVFPVPNDFTNPGAVCVISACVRARAMRRDDSMDFISIVDACLAALGDASTSPERARGAATCVGSVTSFNASNRDLNLGLKPSSHARESFLARQRAFSALAPKLARGASTAVGMERLARSLAVVELSTGVDPAITLRREFNIFPLLPDVLCAVRDDGAFADADVASSTLALVSCALDENIAGDVADVHRAASALVRALCDVATQPCELSTSYSIGIDNRERALDALSAVPRACAYAAVFPLRDFVLASAVAACDDPKRRVRRAAGRARQTWLALRA